MGPSSGHGRHRSQPGSTVDIPRSLGFRKVGFKKTYQNDMGTQIFIKWAPLMAAIFSSRDQFTKGLWGTVYNPLGDQKRRCENRPSIDHNRVWVKIGYQMNQPLSFSVN